MAARLRRSSRFYKFLWEVRGELFADGFEEELLKSYRPRGQKPCPPALLAMVLLLQRYTGLSDAQAVDAAENDRRWQLVLGTLGREKAPFGQGTLVRFRTRMVAHDLDEKLLNRTVEIAKQTNGFGWKKLRVSLDSSPLHGAGRVEDTWNLIGRAMAKVVHEAGRAFDVEPVLIVEEAELSVLSANSVKAALDIDWDDEAAKSRALNRLIKQCKSLETWIAEASAEDALPKRLAEAMELLRRIIEQDTEPDPKGRKRALRDGVAKDRVISVSDPEMRHGRKSKSKLFNGYKRYIGVVDGFIVSTTVEPANVREYEPAATLLGAIERHGEIETLDIDRGFLSSDAVLELFRSGVTVNSKAWHVKNSGRFTKEDFRIDLKRGLVTCPADKSASITTGRQVFFSANDCGACALKERCTDSAKRSMTMHRAEDLLIRLRKQRRSSPGRRELRRRTVVEHRLARVGAIQGPKARYRGARKNRLDLNRASAVANLMEIRRRAA